MWWGCIPWKVWWHSMGHKVALTSVCASAVQGYVLPACTTGTSVSWLHLHYQQLARAEAIFCCCSWVWQVQLSMPPCLCLLIYLFMARLLLLCQISLGEEEIGSWLYSSVCREHISLGSSCWLLLFPLPVLQQALSSCLLAQVCDTTAAGRAGVQRPQ